MPSGELDPDPRWLHIVGEVTPSGLVHPIALQTLQSLADDAATIVARVEPIGPIELLQTSRELLVASWFHYEFLAVASLVAFQAVEAMIRQVVYPSELERTPLRRLIRRMSDEGILDRERVEVLDAGAQLRNHLSHPGGQAAFTLGVAMPIIRTSHLFVRDFWGSASSEADASPS